MNPRNAVDAAELHLRLVRQHKKVWYQAYMKRFWESYYDSNKKTAAVVMMNEEGELSKAMAKDYKVLGNQVARVVNNGETIYVSPDICHVIQVMSKGMPEDMLCETDVPFSEDALIVFGSDIDYEEWSENLREYRPVTVRCVAISKDSPVRSWGTGEKKLGMTMTLFASIGAIDPKMNDWDPDDMAMIEVTGWQYQTMWKTAAHPDQRGPHEMSPHVAAFRKFLLCLFRFMQEEIVMVTRERLPRANRRRMAREGLEMPEDGSIVKVELRRVKRVGDEDHVPTHVEWSHRWWVVGHHRFNPRTGEKDIWVRPHVKGPEFLPIVVKQKVTVVSR